MSDPLFEDLKQNFINSVKDTENLNLIEIPITTPQFDEDCPEHYKNGGGIDIWKSRVKNIISIIERSQDNEPFIFSDVDIVFYKPILPILNNLIRSKDVLFLRELFDGVYELQGGNINFGFNIIRSNQKSHRFFNDVLNQVVKTGTWEQMIINQLLYNKNDYDLNWELLPPEFFSTSVGLHHIHKEIKEVVLYHANCAIKKETKFQYMYHIDSVINHRL